MLERSEPALRLICIALAAVLVFQVVRVYTRHNPVGKLSVPALPTLPEKTNAVAGKKGTNALAATNNFEKGTNVAADKATLKAGTNAVSPENAARKEKDTNSIVAVKTETNEAVAVEKITAKKETNTVTTRVEKKSATNFAAEDFGKMNTNLAADKGPKKETNAAGAQMLVKGQTNSPLAMARMGGRNFGMFPGQMGGEKLPDLPPLTQARIDKIVQSEIMAQVTKPQPTGLMGIAGNGAMLRTASGQSGYVKEGGELGGIKLLRVGVNRVLVLEDGKTNELTIFSGLGGETLLPKQGQTNETITKNP